MALGGVFWGIVAQEWGFPAALFGAACALIVAFLVALALPSRIGDSSEISTGPRRSELPCPAGIEESAGPLVVETRYSIRPGDREALHALVRTTSQARLRDGARSWRMSTAGEDEATCVHQLEVASWRDYQRVLSRMPVSDERAEQALNAFHTGESPPPRHYFIRD